MRESSSLTFLHSQIEETPSKAATARAPGWHAINPFAEAQTGHYMKQVIMEIRLMCILVFLSCYIFLKSHLNQDVQKILRILGKWISRCCNLDTLKDTLGFCLERSLQELCQSMFLKDCLRLSVHQTAGFSRDALLTSV